MGNQKNSWKSDILIKSMLGVVIAILTALYSTTIDLTRDFNQFKGVTISQTVTFENFHAETKVIERQIQKMQNEILVSIKSNTSNINRLAEYTRETRAEQIQRGKSVGFIDNILNGGCLPKKSVCNQ